MPVYTQNSELKKLADEIIAKHKPNLKMLNICYMFRDVAAIADDKITAGMCRRVDDLNYTIHKFDFVIEIAHDIWEEASPEFRVALMHHELCHCGIRLEEDGVSPAMDEKTGRLKTYCHKHDVEDFDEIIKEYGAYHGALRSFLNSFAQSVKAAKAAKKSAEKNVSDDSE